MKTAISIPGPLPQAAGQHIQAQRASQMQLQTRRLLLLVVIVSLLTVTACQGGRTAPGGVENALRAVAAGNAAPADLSITYDDMHGLWGGQTIVASGSGAYERRERGRGASTPTVITGTLDRQQIQELASLLVDLKAWEQRVPERAPVPDESRATLKIRVGTTEVAIWEWYNDLPKNDRITRISDRMRSFGDKFQR
jgi:hypothetical protein